MTAPAKSGRPTREQAAARHEALLDHALDHFLARAMNRRRWRRLPPGSA